MRPRKDCACLTTGVAPGTMEFEEDGTKGASADAPGREEAELATPKSKASGAKRPDATQASIEQFFKRSRS